MVGKFWICPTHGQLPEAKPFTPMRIFLSYGHDSNEELVRQIKADLEKRGHDVWFDKSDIKGGLDWRRSITEGIVDSNRVLSFLSRHSTRDPGVCLDEIAIAIGVKGGNIQTILVESEKEVKPPPSISHIQWLDMHDWKDKYAASGAEWEKWYQEKFTEIVAVVESDESRRFAGEIKTLEEHLKPISSDSRIFQLLRKGLVGRAWLVEAIEQWRNASDRTSRLFWIVGAPGVGKSAFAAHLAHYGRDKVIAVQFCEYDKPDHRSAYRIVRTLAFQIATRLPDYRKLLLTLPEIKDLDRKNPSELFDYLLTNPLRNAIDGGRDRYLVVIDALDEAGGNGRNELVEMLVQNAPRLPDWIGIVVTSRPEKAVTAPLQGLKPFILDTETESNRADIRDYLRCELALHLQNRPYADRLVEKILEKSEGVFLYVERFCDDVQRGHLSLDNPEQFPQGLGGIFFQYFQRQFPDLEKFRKDVRPALRAILAAREPLPLEILQRLFNWQDEELHDFTRPLASLFPVTPEAGHEVIKPYHKSLADWLADEAKSGTFFVSLLEGHRLLAEVCWMEYARGTDKMTKYSIRHVRAHLARIGDTERKDKIESDRVYIALFSKGSLRDRVLRVWISSTFSDMHCERDYLVKYVFPQLREFCELKNVTLLEVDLRWGITKEQADKGLVLDIVLSEIDECRPYFIGIIGEKYGYIPSIPQSISQSTLARHPWLVQFKGRSFLEIEAVHGALRQDVDQSEALFYFRDSLASTLIQSQQGLSSTSESKHEMVLLRELKQRIRVAASEGRCSLRENFKTPEELGDWVLKDLIEKIDPQKTIRMSEVESSRHLTFARRKVKTYLPRQGHFEQLDATLLSHGKPLLVIGEVGIGKSSLLANWSVRRQESHPIEIVLMHFAGSVPDSTSPKTSEVLKTSPVTINLIYFKQYFEALFLVKTCF